MHVCLHMQGRGQKRRPPVTRPDGRPRNDGGFVLSEQVRPRFVAIGIQANLRGLATARTSAPKDSNMAAWNAAAGVSPHENEITMPMASMPMARTIRVIRTTLRCIKHPSPLRRPAQGRLCRRFRAFGMLAVAPLAARTLAMLPLPAGYADHGPASYPPFRSPTDISSGSLLVTATDAREKNFRRRVVWGSRLCVV